MSLTCRSLFTPRSSRRTAPRWLVCVAVLLVLLLNTAPIQAQSLFADPTARQVGDVLTIVLEERTAAQQESEYANRSRASLGGQGEVEAPTLSGRFGLDARFNKEASNRNQTVQSDLLRGTITARVVEVDPIGNLRIRGERRLNVNGVTHLMRVAGTVRSLDIRYDNTLRSYQIADAEVEYRRAGFARKFIKPTTFVKLGALGILGAAILYAL